MAQKIQFLRNGALYPTHEATINALTTKMGSLSDGEIVIGRYGDDTHPAKAIIGVVTKIGNNVVPTFIDNEAVSTALQTAIEGIKGANLDDDYATLKQIETKIKGIVGNGTGSIASQITAAIEALDANFAAVDGEFVTGVTETDGVVTAVLKGSLDSTDKTVSIDKFDLSVNVDGTTIVKDANTGELSVVSSALTQYGGADAVKVSDAFNGVKTISIEINDNDKVLTQNENGVLTNIDLLWDKTKGLQLVGKNNTVIRTIAAADFIKDGMLDNAMLVVVDNEHPIADKENGTYIKFTFNTDSGKSDIYLDVTTLIDIYTAGNGINVNDKEISVKKDISSEDFLSVGVNGVKVSGVQTAINTAAAKATTQVNAKASGHVTVAVTTDEIDNHAIVTVSENDIASAALLGNTTDDNNKATAFGKIVAEKVRAQAAEAAAKTVVDTTEGSGIVLTPAVKDAEGEDGHTVYTIEIGTVDCGTFDDPTA